MFEMGHKSASLGALLHVNIRVDCCTTNFIIYYRIMFISSS